MRKVKKFAYPLLISFVGIMFFSLMYFYTPESYNFSNSARNVIIIHNQDSSPREMIIKSGENVTFINQDSGVVNIYFENELIEIASKSSYSKLFDKKGEFLYFINPEKVRKIIVK